MPTSSHEAQTITDIARTYLPPSQLAAMCRQLYQEVGSTTDNDSLRVTLSMLYQMTAVPAAKPPRPPSPYVTLRAYPWPIQLLVIFHLSLILGNTVALCIIPFSTAWYIALPLCSVIIYLAFNRHGDCPLTQVEDGVRKMAGLPPTRGFIGHYIIRPLRRQVWKSST